jgi:hypothetical protein
MKWQQGKNSLFLFFLDTYECFAHFDLLCDSFCCVFGLRW